MGSGRRVLRIYKEALRAPFVMSLRARCSVIAVAEPQGVNGLRFIVNAKSDSQGTQVGLDCADAEPQLPRSFKVRTGMDICTEHFELAIRRR